MTLRRREYFSENDGVVDQSEHPVVVEYAIRELFKGKSVESAAKHTVKKLSGFENFFLGSGIVKIDPKKLTDAIYQRLVDAVIEGIGRVKPGKEDYALDGVVANFKQSTKVRNILKNMVVKKIGHDPFVVG